MSVSIYKAIQRNRTQLFAVDFMESKYIVGIASLAADRMVNAVLIDALFCVDQ